MGYAYHELVPQAILFSNPGITRERFAQLLNRTWATYIEQFDFKDSWRKRTRFPCDEHHGGLDGLAGILNLEDSEDFLKFQTPNRDENNLSIPPPFLMPLNEDNAFFPMFRYELILHEKNILGKIKKVKELAFGKLKVGNIWSECMCGSDRGLVTKIYSEHKIGNDADVEEGESSFERGPAYEYEMDIRPLSEKLKPVVFKSEEELYQHYPLFNPKLKFNWNQDRGQFFKSFDCDSFFWLRKGNKYYLDPKSLDIMPDSFMRTFSFGYHDLVLTAEAIKQKAWKLLSYKGLKHFPQFLKDFPQSKAVYERAIWDSQTSLYAKSEGMTTTEFLRFRHPNFL